MIDFRILGTLDLRERDGGELRSALSGPKRLGVLAYLVFARPRGFHRRDTLVGLFWPEHDQRHARSALRNVLFVLRRCLGPGVVLARGDEDVGIADDELWCDAVAFEDALEAGRIADALSLYRGDLLSGLFVPGAAPEFEHWLGGERDRLRRRAVDAAMALAEAAEAAGDLRGAIGWVRRASSLSPYDERTILQLLALMRRAGDRAGAVRAYETFSRRLKSDLDLDPGARLRTAAAALRGSVPPGDPHHVTRPGRDDREPGEPRPERREDEGTERSGARQNARQRALRQPWRPRLRATYRKTLGRAAGRLRRPGTWVGALLAVVLGVTAVTAVAHGRTRHEAESSRNGGLVRVAVLPFEIDGSPTSDFLRDGVMNLLGTALDGLGPLRTVDAARLERARQDVHASSNILARGRMAADRLGADYVVVGHALISGGAIEISASIYGHGAQRITRTEVEGTLRSIPQLVDTLAVKIFVDGLGAPGADASSAALTTRSLTALKDYLNGVRAYDEARLAPPTGRFSGAVRAFSSAIKADSSFALARYRLGQADGMANDLAGDRKQLTLALREQDRLTPRYRNLARSDLAYLNGDIGRTEELLRRVVAAYPRDGDAWSDLAATLAFQNPVRGRPIAEARQALDRTLALRPRDRPALTILVMLALRQGRLAEADSALAVLDSTGTPLYDQAVFAAIRGDSTARLAILRREREASAMEQVISGFKVAIYTANLDFASRILRPVEAPGQPAGLRFLAEQADAEIAMARGRYRQARLMMASVNSTLRGYGLPLETLMATLPFRQSDITELQRLKANILAVDPTSMAVARIHLALDARAEMQAPMRQYLLGLIDARLHELDAAARYAHVLQQWSGTGPDAAVAPDLARGLLAEIALRRGNASQALSQLQQLTFRSPIQSSRAMIGMRVRERFLRGELLREAGEPRRALRWLGSIGQSIDAGPDELVYLAPARLEMARCYAQLGEPGRAAREYARFLGLWKNADPEMQPLLREARSQLGRLQAARRDASLER